jgi:hypothetical protein
MIAVKGISKYKLDLVGVQGGQMGQGWHQTSTQIDIFLWKRERKS